MQQDNTIPQPALPPTGTTDPFITPPPVKEPRQWRGIFSTVAILVAAPLLALGLTSFVFQSYEVDGPSMETTLQHQDRLIISKVPRTLARITNNPYMPDRGDVVIFVKHGLYDFGETNGDKQLIKRVIALPGERVLVRDGKITVFNNDHPNGFNPDTDGGYGNTERSTPGNVDLVVPKDQIFVCGDNRTNSLDSRVFGAIPADDIVGKLVFRLIPLSKAKTF